MERTILAPVPGAGILTRIRGYRFAQPPATFWQPSGLTKLKRQFLIVCRRWMRRRNRMNPPESFVTARLLLRKPRPDDAPLIFAAYAQDAEITRYLTWQPHKSLADAHAAMERRIDGWESGADFSWMICTRDGSELIGSISARPDGHRVDFGYLLARSYWGRGLMTEALLAIVQWAFTEPSIFRVWAVCDIENPASVRVLEKAGFKREGILKQWAIHPNISSTPRDCFSYSKTRN
jgi:ribosomal-protein-alanine N-acetyltransferase